MPENKKLLLSKNKVSGKLSIKLEMSRNPY
jgi:hypothetical protein